MRNLPFYKPSIYETEKRLINEVLKLKEPMMFETIEKNMASYIGAKYAISTYNGTAEMHLAMCAMNLKRGDKIICSVNSFPSVAEVIRHFDAEPIFVDIDQDDYMIDPNSLETVLEKHQHKKLKGFLHHPKYHKYV